MAKKRAAKKATRKNKSVVEEHLSAIKKDIARFVEKKSAKRPVMYKKSFLGHKTNRAFYALIAILLMFILILLIMYISTVHELKSRERAVLLELAVMEQERDQYYQAYMIVLEDAQAFGKMYDVIYDGRLVNESAFTNGDEEKVSGVETNKVLKEVARELSTTNVWGFYNERGIISDECIETTKLVQAIGEELEIVIVTEAERDEAWPHLRLLVNAQELVRFDVTQEEEQIHKFKTKIPQGTHYIDILFDNADVAGDLTISLVRIGDRTIENDITILDYGVGLGIFDCEDTAQGTTLKKNGAMRFRIELV